MAAAGAFVKGFLQTYANSFVPKDAKAFWKDVQAMIGIEILVEAGKRRWSSIEACACEGDCLFVEEEGVREKQICIKKIVEIGIELLEGGKEVLEKVLCMELNTE